MYLMGSEDSSALNEDLGYWRKHPNLHGFIVEEFAGGVDECQPIPLTLENLERILEATRGDRLPHTTGFFFGASTSEDKPHTVEVITNAISWLKERPGRRVVYQASW